MSFTPPFCFSYYWIPEYFNQSSRMVSLMENAKIRLKAHIRTRTLSRYGFKLESVGGKWIESG